MSYRLSQLSPQTSTRGINVTMAVRRSSDAANGTSPDAQFLRSWLEYDSSKRGVSRGRVNWGAVSGLALAVAVSATFWAAMGLIVVRLWR